MAIPLWNRALLLLAALKIAAGIAGVFVGWIAGSGGVAHSMPLGVFLLQIGVFAGSAAFLISGARGDARALSLGAVFAVVATSYALVPIQVLGAWAEAPLAVRALAGLQLDAFLPALLWLFFRDFPRALDSGGVRRAGRLALGVSVAAGVALFLANAALVPAGDGSPLLERFAARRNTSAYWAIVYGLTLPAFPFALWRTRTASLPERRRVALFLAGALLGATPVALFILLFALLPDFAHWSRSPGVAPVLMPVVQLLVLSIPVTTAYAVLVDRALEVRVIVRKALQYGLARAIVAAAATLPFAWFALYLYRHRDETLSRLVASSSFPAVAAALAAGVATLRLRRRAVAALDGLFFREQYDSRRALVELAERSRRCERAEELAQLLRTEIDRALHLESIAVLLADPFHGQLRAVGRALRPLDTSSELARFLGASSEPVVVDLERTGSPLRALPEDDRQWLADGAVALLVPLVSAGQELIGAIALGPKRSELPFSREDRQLLSAIGASGAIALENRILRAASAGGTAWRPDSEGGSGWDRSVAKECTRCLALHPSGSERCDACAGSLAPIAIPYRILDKFRLEARIGVGGMGVVYRAVDLTLQRKVAVKTLPRTSPEDSLRLRREARAMAAIAHPNLALIYGAETWRGTPILILEYLEGGTLADRIEKSPLPPREAVAIGAILADVLACIHRAGILHRDVKPSNVAFTREGVPKLLDFGLARMVSEPGAATGPLAQLGEAMASSSLLRTEGVIGTPLYMSPEALRNEVPDAAFDLWGLAVVLYEAIAGRHPFRQSTWPATLDAILHGRVPDLRTLAPQCSQELAALFGECLGPEPRRRPSSARELAERLAHAAV